MSGAPSSDVAIRLDGVGKRYVLHKQKPYLLHEVLKRVTGAARTHEEFWALREVSLTIRPGESVAFIGRNGAGKSTLLGLIARAISPTTGRVEVNGRLGALLELGAGFHPELTGRENVYLNASLLGLSRAEIEGQFDAIVAFAELGDFIDVPLRNYSSGMYVRLGFSVAIHIRPEIVLMDEALAVGDAAFQEKCLARIAEIRAAGKTLLFVSHSADLVRHLCPRAIWLDHGRLRGDGPAAEVLEAYHAAG